MRLWWRWSDLGPFSTAAPAAPTTGTAAAPGPPAAAATAAVAAPAEDELWLSAANLGDSGYLILRKYVTRLELYRIVPASDLQRRSFAFLFAFLFHSERD